MFSVDKGICYIADMGHHYREPIFNLLHRELGCEFYFGDKISSVKSIDHLRLPGFIGYLHYIKLFGDIHLIPSALRIALRYKKIILLGDLHGVHNWLILILCYFLGNKVYLWTHGWYGREGIVKKIIKLIFFKLSAGVFTYGSYAKRLMIKNGIPGDKIHVVFNSLNYSDQIILRSECHLSDVYFKKFGNHYPVIIYIGRVQAVKKIDLLVKAANELRKLNKCVNVVIVGDLSECIEITNLVSKLELQAHIWFYGPCYDESVISSLIFNADLCVSPGNVGLTAMHSLVYGCPVITHNDFTKQMPEFEAIIEGVNGAFFQYNSLSDLVVKISNWLDYSFDNREIIRSACYEVVDSIWNPFVQVKIFKKVLFND